MKYFAKKIDGKLFLCSRDIKVGDEYYVDIPDISLFEKRKCAWVETIPDILGGGRQTGFDEGAGFQYEHEAFKVVGEIFPETKWVKEGDEFEAAQVHIVPMYEKQFPDEYDQPVIFKYNQISFRCPTCGNWH